MSQEYHHLLWIPVLTDVVSCSLSLHPCPNCGIRHEFYWEEFLCHYQCCKSFTWVPNCSVLRVDHQHARCQSVTWQMSKSDRLSHHRAALWAWVQECDTPHPIPINLIQSRSSFGVKNSATSLCNTKLLLALEFTFYGLPDVRVHHVLVKEHTDLPISNKGP